MIEFNQSFNIDSVGGAHGTPATEDTVAIKATQEITQTASNYSDNQIRNDGNILPVVLSIVAIVMAFSVGYLYYKLIGVLKEKMADALGRLKDQEKENTELRGKIQQLEESLQTSRGSLSQLSSNLNRINNKIELLSSRFVSEGNNISVQKLATQNKPKQLDIYYANLQSPDQNGDLKFAIRGFSSQPSVNKMFIVEVDETAGRGIYKVNSDAMMMILNDLQLFNLFVKPYNFSGRTDNLRISTRKPGVISKNGQVWMVEEKLEISVN